MNGELFQIASLAAASKRAMRLSETIRYSPQKYDNSVRFAFLPRKKLFRTIRYTAPDVESWFEKIKKDDVQDIKMLCPYSVENRMFSGFSNSTKASIVCFHKNGRVTYFMPDWQFDSARKQWNVLYSEYEWTNPPLGKPHFEDNTDSFRKVLLSIKELALKIGCDGFAGCFGSAIEILNGADSRPDAKYGLEMPQIPQKNLRLFEAASAADVFGAMGSWNDSPPYRAHEKGLEKEYNALSDELLKNVRLAVLYAINEW